MLEIIKVKVFFLWDINLEILDYKFKFVIGVEEMKIKLVIRYYRSLLDIMINILFDLKEERKFVIEKFK